MTLPNHLAGGFVFTGVFAGIAGINILESPGLLVMTFVAATIADIDVPSSLWGRALKPISRRINRRFGHRTFTHSLLFMGMLWGVVWLGTRLGGSELPYPAVFLLGFSSHLIFDMMTVQGVLLLFPYVKRPCVIPADPTLRLKTNNPGSELALFGFFILSGLFMQPLMADGFWTSYNRLFGTLAHLQSEFEKSDDLLRVDYRYREGSQEYVGQGFAIEATGSSTTLWSEQGGWQYLDGSPTSSRTILEVIPTHTGQGYELVRESFVSVSADSLQRLLAGQAVYQLQFSANEPLEAVYEARDGSRQVRQTKFTLDQVESILLREISEDNEPEEVVYQVSPRIGTLESKQRKLQAAIAAEAERLQLHEQEANTVKSELAETTDIYHRTRLLAKLEELDRTRQQPSKLGDQLEEVSLQLEEVRRRDDLNHRERIAQAAANAKTGDVPLQLSGIATLVRFSGQLD